MRFLVINVLNDCCICMWFIVCMYVGISGRNYFRGGGGGGGENCETREKRIIIIIYFLFFMKNSESVILVGTVQTKPKIFL